MTPYVALRFSGVAKRNVTNELNRSKRQRFLLSGLAKCGHCGARYTMISATLLGCAAARLKGTCDNRVNIRHDRLEERVLHALRHRLMDPGLFKEFCDEFTREENRLRMDGRAAIHTARTEIKKIDRDLDMLVNLILRGGAADKINARMVAMEARKKELENSLQAAEVIRSLVDEIILLPEDVELKIDVRGDLAGILSIAVARKKPAGKAGLKRVATSGDPSQLPLVAGAGFEPGPFQVMSLTRGQHKRQSGGLADCCRGLR